MIKTPYPPFRPAGFTLIELLVVVSIISLLISLLLPALAQARKSAENLQCQTNLRGISVGVHQYVADNKNDMPNRYYTSSEFGLHEFMPWVSRIEPYYMISNPLPHSPVDARNYPKPWYCSASKLPPARNMTTAYWTNYAINMGLAHENPLYVESLVPGAAGNRYLYVRDNMPRFDHIINHSKTILLGESQSTLLTGRPPFGTPRGYFNHFQGTSGNQANVTTPIAALSANAYGNTSGAGFWHGPPVNPTPATSAAWFSGGNWGNYAWIDGHVSTIKPEGARNSYMAAGNHPAKRL
jgi:prepilin-type N-terminal cleavage/methylation domain-containing protein/prepilin-type processing-associated H-X9-DG protein